MSQPSLSAAIQKLEEELGGELFERQGRSIKLTQLGVAMRTHLSRIEQAKQAASRAAEDIVHGEASVIDLGFMCTLSPQRLLTAIASFGQAYPQSELLIHDIWEAKALDLLLSGALDCVIMAHTTDLPDRFVEQRLAEEPMLLAMHEAHPLSKSQNIGMNNLQGQHYVDRLRCEFREVFFAELGTRNLDVQTVMRSEREDLVSKSIQEGIGVSIMPESAARNAGLQTRELSDMCIVRRISIVSVRDRTLHPSAEQFIQLVCAAYRRTV